MHQVLDPLPHACAGVELDRLARLNRGTVMLIVESYLWLGADCGWFPQEDIGRCWGGVWSRLVVETEICSAPTSLNFRGRGSGREAGETGIDFSSIQRFPVLSINTKVVQLA